MNQEIITLINKLSPHASEYLKYAYEKGIVEEIYFQDNDTNKGTFIFINDDEMGIFFASFENESYPNDILKLIEQKTEDIIRSVKKEELCFNVYGKNSRIINLVKNLGFTIDMEGYHYQYNGGKYNNLSSNLKIIEYKESMIDEFVDLFDSAYFNLNRENNWRTNIHEIYKQGFNKKLIRLNNSKQMQAFALNNELIGAYIYEDNYITDLVVKPLYQNLGHGSYIIKHCINNMIDNKIDKIRLRVAKSNIDAIKLYERLGFSQIGYFAEHNYK